MSTAQHYRAPKGADTVFNRTVRWLADRGLNLAGAHNLTVIGRVSGRPQTVPVNPVRVGDAEYLVAVRGETQWVRNARAAGRAQLRLGRRVRPIDLAEIEPSARGPILREYLRRWGREVGRFLPEGMSTTPSDADLERFAPLLPVFAVTD